MGYERLTNGDKANVETFQLVVDSASYLGSNSIDDYIVGTDSNDTLSGGTGMDSLFGYGGNDVLDGGSGADSMYGHDGNDLYIVDNANDLVVEYPVVQILGGGYDHLKGDAGNDDLYGDDGNDTLRGYDPYLNLDINQYDYLLGGNGADRFALGNSLFRDSARDIFYLERGHAIIADFDRVFPQYFFRIAETFLEKTD